MNLAKKTFYILLVLFVSGCSFHPLKKFWPANRFWKSSELSPPAGVRVSINERAPRKEMLPAPALDFTPEVKRQITRFVHRDPRFIPLALKRRSEFYHEVRSALHSYGVPDELLNLAMIESGFKTNARSGVGALGIWQFMKGTAKVYGLTVNLLVDERKDPVESSKAAARHLRDLYLAYESWHLALAAYNCGTARVDRAIRKLGTKDFWKLSRAGLFPKQTREFVPRFIAVTMLVKDPARFSYVQLMDQHSSHG